MLLTKGLEIDLQFYEPTKQTLIKNGSNVSEQFYGSRRILYGNNQVCGFAKMDHHLPMSDALDSNQFYAFLGAFKRSLYNQIRKNNSLLDLKIDFDGDSKAKNVQNWNKIKNKSVFYNIDIASAYWQIAHKLGYISTKLFNKYLCQDDFKQAKRYCISFLARENDMIYYDNREINHISCDNSAFYQIYANIRNELYKTINEIKNVTEDWVEYNIDAVTIMEKDLNVICDKFQEIGLQYKVNQCVKIDFDDYFMKDKIRKF